MHTDNTLEIFGDKCACGRRATQAEHQMCDRCWVVKHSTQYINGEYVPFVEWFRTTKGAKRDSETREQWFARCKEEAHGSINTAISKVQG